MPARTIIHTVGHSTRSLDDFTALLRAYDVAQVVDVRTVPRSRHNPQYNGLELGGFLRDRRIAYEHMADLGGLRHARADSANTGWRNASFRGFADYMQTPAFAGALATLIALAREKPTAIMCAEAVPWRCHRSLIGDALLVRGLEVRHIIGPKSAREHHLTAIARVRGLQITYPPP